MIVTINDNNSDKYLNLFTESYEYLKGLDKGYVDINKERFSSLAEYYSHMADFFENQKYKYVMLPLDEEPFNIDLNTRTIAVPSSFIKCAGVQKDQLAETIVFVVDRYFDYMDLANTEIFVQWTIPENKKANVAEYNGATRIEMMDLESEPGKLKFAWPLNDKITAVPGNVLFSVRFFRVDDSSPNKLLYSLNTLNSTIIIKEALQPELNAETTVESPVSDDSFKKAILNSIFATNGVVPPVQPVYFTPGSNINASTMMEVDGINIVSLENDTITLKVQAVVADAGELSYKWYYQDSKGVYYDCEHYPVFDDKGEIVENEFTTFGTVQDAYIPFEVKPTERVKNERYYTKDALGAYKLYTGNIPTDEVLYERYSTFTVPATGNITGNYQAAAWNNIAVPAGARYNGILTQEEFENGTFYIKVNNVFEIATEYDVNAEYYVDKVLTTVHPTRSDSCLLPGPAAIAFKANGNLSSGAILAEVMDAEENVSLETVLKVETVADNYQPDIVYEWRTSTESAEAVLDPETEVIEITEDPILTVSTPGWYTARVVSELNREQKFKFSEVCKVTKFPEPPVVEVQEHQLVSLVNGPVSFTIKPSVKNPDNINEKLLTDSYIYIWQIHLPDLEDYMTIPETYTGVSGVGTDTLTVNSNIKTSSANFRCLVVNKLNDCKAVFDHSGSYKGDALHSLGLFKNEAPYIYENSEDNFLFTVINY